MKSEDYAAAATCLEIKRQLPEKNIPFEYTETIKNLALVRLSQKRSIDALELVAHARQLDEGDKETGPASATGQKFWLYMAEKHRTEVLNLSPATAISSTPRASTRTGRYSGCVTIACQSFTACRFLNGDWIPKRLSSSPSKLIPMPWAPKALPKKTRSGFGPSRYSDL